MAADVAPTDGGSAGLPEAAQRRLGHGPWSSSLSVADFASSVALGIEPVGFVQGYAVVTWRYVSGYAGRPVGYRTFTGYPNLGDTGDYMEQWRCPHGFVGGEHRMFGYNFEQVWVEQAWRQGYGLAFGRMLEEAVGLGAHGVIGLVDDMTPLAGTGAEEFSIRGTAVVVPGAKPPPRPFTTFLAGQRLVKLLEAGFMPVSVVAVSSAVQMWGYCMTAYQMVGSAASWSGGVAGVTSIDQVDRAQRAVRELAREHARAELGGDTLHGVSLQVSEREIGEADLSLQCVLKGTRVRRFKDFDPLPPPTPVVRLT